VATGTLAAVGAFLAACGGGDSNPTAPPPGGTSVTVTLASFPALAAVGGIARVTTTGTPIAVVRSGPATYRAFSMVCPHQGTTIGITATGFRCPNHGATFNANGGWIGGERTSGLVEFTVTSNATAGTITITS
jgi:thiosulfate dehydrogenase [quinone] large subunit